MSSEVQICNRALIKIGAKTILSLSDETKNARLCNTIYADERDTLLRSHPWNFAIRRASLALVAEVTPNWDYTYQLPTDCLRVIYPDVQVHLYRIENKRLLTNVLLDYVLYITKVTDVTKFDPSFTSTLACKLAMVLAKAISDNEPLLEQMAEGYARAIVDARSVGAMEQGPLWIDSEEWLTSRYMGIAGPTGWLRDNRRL